MLLSTYCFVRDTGATLINLSVLNNYRVIVLLSTCSFVRDPGAISTPAAAAAHESTGWPVPRPRRRVTQGSSIEDNTFLCCVVAHHKRVFFILVLAHFTPCTGRFLTRLLGNIEDRSFLRCVIAHHKSGFILRCLYILHVVRVVFQLGRGLL